MGEQEDTRGKAADKAKIEERRALSASTVHEALRAEGREERNERPAGRTSAARAPRPPVQAARMIEPIRCSVPLGVPPARAFDLFTRELGRWWPLSLASFARWVG